MSKVEKSLKSAPPERRQRLKGNKLVYLIILALLLVLAVGSYIGYQKYNDLKRENQKLSDPQEATRQETQRTKDAVAKLIDVPQGEDPTIASVVDTEKLSNQPFFKNAQNGDKVLMYAQAKKAILYRPSTNKIIEVAPINIGDNPAQTSKDSPAPEEAPPEPNVQQ